jgi:hypothetical protein
MEADMKKSVEKVEIVELKPIDIGRIPITLEGDTPLIVHAWSEKAKKMMLEKQMKKASTGREARDPVREFIESLYWLTEKPETPDEKGFEKALKKGAKFGFPSIAFKAAAVSGGYRAGMTKDKVSANGAFHIADEFVEIHGVPEMREDMVRLSGLGSPADLRYRGEFKQWRAVIEVQYNKAAISAEQVINLFSVGGFASGVGEHRPEKGGVNGRFHVKTD